MRLRWPVHLPPASLLAAVALGGTLSACDALGAASFGSVTLARGGCYGACPVYSVAIRDDGLVTYTGMRDVAVAGVHTGKLTPAQLRALAATIAQARAEAKRSEEPGAERSCGPYVTDGPSITVTLSEPDGARAVALEQACTGPGVSRATLDRLIETIDTLARTERWIRGTPAGNAAPSK